MAALGASERGLAGLAQRGLRFAAVRLGRWRVARRKRDQARRLAKYHELVRSELEYIFLSIARFCHINRPTTGYYFEFGCHGGNTMRLAWSAFRDLFDFRYVAFDSFEGLPAIQAVDRLEIFQKGKLRTAEDDFRRLMASADMPSEKLRTVKGFYDESLTPDLQRALLPERAAVIYVDCDLYTSTVPVLEFIRPFLQRGTVLIFDDWNCYHADPDRGERRAFREFREKHPELRFEPWISTNIAQAFISLGPA